MDQKRGKKGKTNVFPKILSRQGWEGVGVWRVRWGGVGGSWTVFHIDETFVYACATQEQGPRVCRKVGGIIGGS